MNVNEDLMFLRKCKKKQFRGVEGEGWGGMGWSGRGVRVDVNDKVML